MSDDQKILGTLIEIRNWIRASSYESVKALLKTTLPDDKSRAAYQALDGKLSMEQIRIKCKMSPNTLSGLAQRCTALGLMETRDDKKRVRLFDLSDFGLLAQAVSEFPDGE